MHKVGAVGFTDKSQLLLPTSQVKLYCSLKLPTYVCSFYLQNFLKNTRV